MSRWSSQKLNIDGATNAPRANGGDYASSDPFVSEYNDQLHVAYAADGEEDSPIIVDVWSSGFRRNWTHQRIDRDSSPDPIRTGPSIGVYQDQQHFCYVRGAGALTPGEIVDSFYDGNGNWDLQQVNANAGTPGAAWSLQYIIHSTPTQLQPPFLVSIWTLGSTPNQQHFTYVDFDNNIWDAFFDGNTWPPGQQLNNGGNTNAPPAVGKPFGCVFTPPEPLYLPPSNLAGQQHVAYLAEYGEIHDTWFDGQTGHRWTSQKLNLNGRTTAPSAAGPPFVWVVPTNFFESYHNQQHFTYLAGGEESGEIWDMWYDYPANKWSRQKLNVDGKVPYKTTDAPAAAGNPFACIVGVDLEQHVGYRDADGTIWDIWYDGSPEWNSRKINLDGMTNAPAAIGDPFISYYTVVDNLGDIYGQLHFIWCADGGEIWDAWQDLPMVPGQPSGRG